MQIKKNLCFRSADYQRILKYFKNYSKNSLSVRNIPLTLHPQSALKPVPLRNGGSEGLTRREIFEEIPID